MKNKVILISMMSIFLLTLVSSLDSGGILTGKQNNNIQLPQECASCSYVNITSIQYPDMTREFINTEMTKQGTSFNYTFSTTDQLGTYTYCFLGDVDGIDTVGCKDFQITSTGSKGSMFYIILITALAVIFLLTTLFVDEEFFVYISGVLWLVGGIYLMINGLDIMNDVNTRYLSYVYIGLGMLFTIGAYVYNSYSKYREDEY